LSVTHPDHIISGFQNRARTTFYAIYNDFQACAIQLDRSRQEHEYRQLQERYVGHLHEKLSQLAHMLLHEHRYEHDKDTGFRLNEIIQEYIHEFVVHTRDL
jgi:hypothetical protein